MQWTQQLLFGKTAAQLVRNDTFLQHSPVLRFINKLGSDCSSRDLAPVSSGRWTRFRRIALAGGADGLAFIEAVCSAGLSTARPAISGIVGVIQALFSITRFTHARAGDCATFRFTLFIWIQNLVHMLAAILKKNENQPLLHIVDGDGTPAANQPGRFLERRKRRRREPGRGSDRHEYSQAYWDGNGTVARKLEKNGEYKAACQRHAPRNVYPDKGRQPGRPYRRYGKVLPTALTA